MICLSLKCLKTRPILKVWQLNRPQNTFGVLLVGLVWLVFLQPWGLRNQPFNLPIFFIPNYLLSEALWNKSLSWRPHWYLYRKNSTRDLSNQWWHSCKTSREHPHQLLWDAYCRTGWSDTSEAWEIAKILQSHSFTHRLSCFSSFACSFEIPFFIELP